MCGVLSGFSHSLSMAAVPFCNPTSASINLCVCLYLSKYFNWKIKESGSESPSVVFDSLWPYGLYSPWNSPGQNTGLGSLSLLHGIFPTQGLNPDLPHCRQILYQLSHKASREGSCCQTKSTVVFYKFQDCSVFVGENLLPSTRWKLRLFFVCTWDFLFLLLTVKILCVTVRVV